MDYWTNTIIDQWIIGQTQLLISGLLEKITHQEESLSNGLLNKKLKKEKNGYHG
jgi:hypothetical protein